MRKSIKPLRILCDLCASAVNNIVMMFHKWDTLKKFKHKGTKSTKNTKFFVTFISL
jgi:hypothetical protein